MERSKLHFYSIGIVSANKHLDTNDIYATPIEITPFIDGELDARNEEVESEGVDGENQSYNVKVSTSTSIKAEWMPFGNGNRRTAPDVRRGERVLLYKYGDQDRYYWESTGQDGHLRKLETVIYTWSATRDEDADSTDPEKCYSLEVCTHTKQITLRTTKADGEPFAYTCQFNTKEGAVTLTDDVGNYITFDSTDTLIRMENRAGSWLELNKKDINCFAPDNINGEAGKNVSLTAGKDISVKAGGNISEKAGSNINQEAGSNVNTKAGGTATVEGGAGAFLKCGGVTLGVTGGGVSMSG